MPSSDGQTPSTPDADRGAVPLEQRRSQRHRGVWSAQLETTAGRRLNGIVFDISPGGARLRLDEAGPVAKGEVITFISPRLGRRSARVAWMARGHAGLTFLAEAAVAGSGTHGDPAFLRSRAELLRQLAHAAEAGGRLARLAEAFDVKARAIERRQLAPPLTIRKDRRPAPIDQ